MKQNWSTVIMKQILSTIALLLEIYGNGVYCIQPHHEKRKAKTKAQISFAVTAKLISAFVFATWIVQILYILNLKFQASSHFLCLYSSTVCVRPARKPHCWFSHDAAPIGSDKPSLAVLLLKAVRFCVSGRTGKNTLNLLHRIIVQVNLIIMRLKALNIIWCSI